MEISRRKRNRREGIPPARLNRYAHIHSQLIVNRRYLRFGCGDRNRSVVVDLFDLAIHPLHHGFILSTMLRSHGDIMLRTTKYFDKLLGSYII